MTTPASAKAPTKPQLTSRNWFGKASAGLILGFLLALGLSGLLSWAIGVGDTFFSTKGQLTMWVMSPIWSLILSFVFFFQYGRNAWGWLALASGIVWAALYATGKLG